MPALREGAKQESKVVLGHCQGRSGARRCCCGIPGIRIVAWATTARNKKAARVPLRERGLFMHDIQNGAQQEINFITKKL